MSLNTFYGKCSFNLLYIKLSTRLVSILKKKKVSLDTSTIKYVTLLSLRFLFFYNNFFTNIINKKKLIKFILKLT